MMKRDLPELLAAMNARIDQLQAENEEKDKKIAKLKDATISQRRGLRQLRDTLSRVEAEREAAVEFIKWIDEEFGNYMPVLYHHRFEEWRGAQGEG